MITRRTEWGRNKNKTVPLLNMSRIISFHGSIRSIAFLNWDRFDYMIYHYHSNGIYIDGSWTYGRENSKM